MKLNEIFLLWKVQLLGFFGVNQARKSNDRMQKKKARGFMSILLVSVLALGYFSAQYSWQLAASLKAEGGNVDDMPAVMFAVCCMMVFVTSVLKAVSTIFGAGDTDMVMALPVKTSSIVASRVLVLYSMDFIYNLCLMLPMGIIYGIYARPNAAGLIMFAVMFFFTPLVPCVAACVLGTLISWVSAHTKGSTLFKNFFSMLLTAGVLALSFGMSSRSQGQLASIVGTLADKIKHFYPLTRLFTDALCYGKSLPFLLFVAISFAAFALFCVVLGFRFKQLVNITKTRRSAGKYDINKIKTGSPFAALYRKELKRFFSSNIWFMNCGIGAIMMILFTVAIVIARKKVTTMFADDASLQLLVLRLLPFLPSWCVCLTCTSACSVSLEGKNFWLIKSLPVRAKDVLLAKVAMNLTITVIPSLICSTLLAVFLGVGILQRIMLFVLPLLYCVFTAQLGLLANLKYPSLDWKNETTPVKQSTSTFISTLGFMPLTIVPAILTGMAGNLYSIAIIAICLVLAALSAACYGNICKKGEKKLFDVYS